MTSRDTAPARRHGWKPAAMACIMAAMAASAPAQEFVPETLKDGVALPADMPRIYVGDFAIGHLMDGRINVLDGRSGKYAGVIDGGFAGHFTASPDGKQLYVATTYLTRHTHGERHDVVEIYDADTLRITGDVELPPKRAQSAYQQTLSRTSHDGRYLFVQNATPATSVSVVDVRDKKMLVEVPTAGCWGIYPSQTEALRFSMLCGDGKLATVTLDAEGKVSGRAVSAKFFDSGTDPIFTAMVADQARYYFIGFTGTLFRADLRGAEPVLENAVQVVPAAERKAGWRPGGYQLLALDTARKQLFVGMHAKGVEGSHKTPAQEIWTLDLASGKRLARTRALNAIALTVSQKAPNYLYAINGATNQLVAYQLPGLRQVFVSAPIGEAPLQVDAP
ncbi:amine dehydrogenase large subunit [Janthinobacterium sp. PC23-8]|uniref:amine dehydrogenase large subunit n=1 Tax=Janthinobacterium sp. PC23-8 TaxID=2012679 RepID=UPI00159549B1|nr:amine dehydrogenase large subunit [Janthinobacterium sp. PC23-8]